MDSKFSRRSVIGGGLIGAAATAAAVNSSTQAIAQTLSKDRFSQLPLLDEKQAGTLRHYRNLMARPADDWRDLGTPMGSMASAYRYYLAHIAYTQALAHYHHLPAAPGFFKADFDRTITRMLDRQVWDYWLEMSASTPFYDPDLKKPREMWFDPVVKENIMYSGHLNAMVALYAYFFEDAKYDRVGAIRFKSGHIDNMSDDRIDALLSGRGVSGADVETGAQRDVDAVDPNWVRANFADYSLRSLNDRIYWQMAEGGYLGVACEPNMVFLACNLFPMVGLRFEDLRRGTSVADEVARSYFKAWKERDITVNGGRDLFSAIQASTGRKRGPTSAWTHTILNGPNKELALQQKAELMKVMSRLNADGTLTAYPTFQYEAIRKARGAGLADPALVPDRDGFFQSAAAMYYSEMGERQHLDATLAYLDKHAEPTWSNGGYFYTRGERQGGRMALREGANGYAGFGRLNVTDGWNTLYNKPWDSAVFKQPKLTSITNEFDVLRAAFMTSANSLVFRVRPYRGSSVRDVEVKVANAKRQGQWTLRRDDQIVATGDAASVRSGSANVAGWEGDELVVRASAPQGAEFVLSWA